jgi:SOS-response transcriptional repressor LexA
MAEFQSGFALPKILSHLMTEKRLNKSDLAKLTGLPQTTISNIILGKAKSPRPVTLSKLADLFGITIGQLVGYEPIETLSDLSKNFSDIAKAKASALKLPVIPLIEWNEVKSWIFGNNNIKIPSAWPANDICKNSKAFALRAKPSMRSYFFYPNSKLLVDPQTTLRDGSIILVFLDESVEPALRLFSVDGQETRIQPLEEGRPSVPLNPEHLVIGTVVEVRYDPSVI